MITENRLEIEVKIKVDLLTPWRQKIELLPATLESARDFERNIVFDSTQNTLKKKDILLRLRQQGTRSILTLKMPAQENAKYKIREETEVEVSDFYGLEKILRTIGFREFFIYEKYRETFKAQGVWVMTDETPIGNFIEIEGNPERIDEVAASLGFSAADYITDSYYKLFRLSGRPGHMVFPQ